MWTRQCMPGYPLSSRDGAIDRSRYDRGLLTILRLFGHQGSLYREVFKVFLFRIPFFLRPSYLICHLLLSDPSPIIGSACHSLTDSCLVNLIDMTLTCEDAYSILVEVVTVTDVDDEKPFYNSFMKIWKLKFVNKARFCSDFEQRVWSRV